jgi:hypothetical protein
MFGHLGDSFSHTQIVTILADRRLKASKKNVFVGEVSTSH